MVTFAKHKAGLTALAVLGTCLVATGDRNGVLCLWHARTSSCLYRAEQESPVYSLAALSSSLFVAGLENGTLLFFHHRSGEDVSVLHSLPAAHSSHIFCIAAHGRKMVTVSVEEREAKVWDVETREGLGILDQHDCCVRGVAISAKHIVTTTSKEVQVWDTRTLSLLHRIDDKHTDFINSALILGISHVLTVSTDKTIMVTDLATGATVDRIALDFEVFHAATTSDGRIAACGAASGSEGSAIVFPASKTVARIIRAPAAKAAIRILGCHGYRSDRGYYANSAEVRSWRAVANLPFGL